MQESSKIQHKQNVTSLRAQQMAMTRNRILDGLSALIEKVHPMDVTMSAVAAQANVSEPTLYRHFPSKRKLFAALGAELYRKATVDAPPTDVAELIAFLPSLYGFLSENEAVARWNLTGPKEDAIRPSAEERSVLLKNVLSAELEELPAKEAEFLLRAMLLLTSPMALLYWQDYLDLDATQSAETAAWMVRKIAGIDGAGLKDG